jgi:hypothetical protein
LRQKRIILAGSPRRRPQPRRRCRTGASYSIRTTSAGKRNDAT